MNRYVIGSLWDRINRNGANANFEYLFEGRQKIDELNSRADNILNEAKQTNDMNKSVQNQINALIAESGTSDAEVIQARIDESGTVHSVLKERLDKTDKGVKSEITHSKVLGSGENEDIWRPKTMKSLNDYFQNGDGFQLHRFFELYDMFDKLYIDNPDYISKEVKGVIFEGRYDFPVYEYTPENGYSQKIILDGGMHGDERVSLIALYEFLRSVCEDWDTSPQLAYIRNNVKIVVMPLTNPYGIAYVRKTNGEGVDLNRNFDYKHDSIPDANKGPYPESEIETNYIKEVIDANSDAISYLSFHNMAVVSLGQGFSNVSYVPEILPFNLEVLVNLKERLNPIGDNYDIRASDNPSPMSYAIDRYKMNAFTPEYIPGHHASAFSAKDMNKAVEFFGNAVIRFSRLQNKVDVGLLSEPYSIIRYDTNPSGGGKVVPIDSYGLLYLGTFNPRANGMLKVSYTVSYKSLEKDSVIFLTPKLYQKGNREGHFQETTVMAQFENMFGNFSNGGDTRTMTLTAIMPINLYKGYAYYELHGFCRNGSFEVLRMRSVAEFIPSKRESTVFINI